MEKFTGLQVLRVGKENTLQRDGDKEQLLQLVRYMETWPL